MKKIEQNIQELWENYESCKIHVMVLSEREGGKKLKKKIEIIMTESFTKLIIDNKLHIQESQNNQKLETKYKNLYLCILQSNCRRSKTKIKL